ncbi:MAG: transporter substrate-binding domain-containing protein [Spirochaetaceae bacterium]|jgi:ABC-type amino acid transport substrate-binding protein|nr:transporter substrate-binding domain-containing protein [Spirochaetaceae bacterium]
MKKQSLLTFGLLCLLSLFSLHSQSIKAAIIQDSDYKLVDFYQILSERSGVKIQQVPLLRQEIENALEAGIVDIAILPDTQRTSEVSLIQTPAFGKTYVLLGESGLVINQYNLVDLKTVAVFMDDEQLLGSELIDKFSIEPRIQKARHYDSLLKILTTGRVMAVFVSLEDFTRSLRNLNEDPEKFGQPYILGFKENFLVLSRRRADKVAPLMDRIIQALEDMNDDGTMKELSPRP